MDVRGRLERLRLLLNKAGAELYVASRYPNTYYFTLAFDVHGTLLLPLEGTPRFVVSERSVGIAEELAQDCDVVGVKHQERYEEVVLREVEAFKPSSILADNSSWQAYLDQSQRLRDVKLSVKPELLASLRRRKEPEEMELLRKAAEIADRGVEAAFSMLGPGVKQSEVRSEAEYAMLRAGSEEVAFIVLNTGSRSAYPDVCRAEKTIAEGDLGFIDVGPRYRGYIGDSTRCFIVGQPTARQLELVNTVRRVQEEALQMVKPGLSTEEYDSAARRAFAAAGYPGNPPHHTGHGLGLGEDIPYIIAGGQEDVIQLGDVMTVEIGAYVRGFGGARIEDDVVVTEGRPEVLTRFPKDRIVV
ncbi:MAG: Xaa-Pro peptidase family protein [Candidatus Bathyarchaeia archaeon]